MPLDPSLGGHGLQAIVAAEGGHSGRSLSCLCLNISLIISLTFFNIPDHQMPSMDGEVGLLVNIDIDMILCYFSDYPVTVMMCIHVTNLC